MPVTLGGTHNPSNATADPAGPRSQRADSRYAREATTGSRSIDGKENSMCDPYERMAGENTRCAPRLREADVRTAWLGARPFLVTDMVGMTGFEPATP